MLGKMKPKTFSKEQAEALKVESVAQVPVAVTPKSTDPENYPVFDIPVNDKVLIYVPNHVVVNMDGEEELRMDKPWLHSCLDGKRFTRIRCVKGLSEDTGYSGRCPLCDGMEDPWTLANAIIKEQCDLRGLDPNDGDNETVKAIKREHYSNRVIKKADQYYTFPITVIETDPADRKKIITDENGLPVHKNMWYTISKSSYDKKWVKSFEGMEDEPTHPGGYFFVLNYTYESKSGEYSKMDSARELVVIPKRSQELGKFAEIFDKETEDWDVLKAQETVIENQFYEESDMEAATDELLVETRQNIEIHKHKVGGGTDAIGIGQKIPEGQIPTGLADDEDELPMSGEIDE